MVHNVVAEAGRGAAVHVVKLCDKRPYGVAVSVGVRAVAADKDIVFNVLGRVREACVIGLAVIRRVGPAVGLDTYGDVELRNFQHAPYVADLIVVGVVGVGGVAPGDHSVCGSDPGNAGVHTAVLFGVVGAGVIEADAGELITVLQAVHFHLVFQRRRHDQGLAVILLVEAGSGDLQCLLVEQGEGQIVRLDLVGIFRRGAGIVVAFHRFVYDPSGDGRVGQGEGVVLLQDPDVIGNDVALGVGDRPAVHIHEADGDCAAYVSGIEELNNVQVVIGGEDQGLLHRVGMELPPCQFRMGSSQRVIVHVSRIRHGVHHIAINVLVNVCRRHFHRFGVLRELLRIEDKPDRVFDLGALHAVDKGDLVILPLQGYALFAFLGTVALHGDGVLGDRLSNDEIRVGNCLYGGYFQAVFVDVADGVAEDGAVPVGIDGGVRCDLVVPVKEIGAVRRRVPVAEDEAFLGGLARVRRLAVLLQGLIVEQFGADVVAVNVRDLKGGRRPFGMEHQVVVRHRAERVRVQQFVVLIPAAPGVVAVVDGVRVGGLIRRIIIGLSADVRLKKDVVEGLQEVAVEVILDTVPCPVEIVAINVHERDVVTAEAAVSAVPALTV